MLMLYNSTNRWLSFTIDDTIDEYVVYRRMMRHGIRLTYCQWMVPGTFDWDGNARESK